LEFKRKGDHRIITQKVKPLYAVFSFFTAGSLCSLWFKRRFQDEPNI
jgi:hypothetical protein